MKEIINLSVASFICILLITLPFLGFLSLLLSLVYLIFIFLPFLPLITKINAGFIEKFVLANFAGLSYSVIILLLDPVFNIKLTKLLFIFIPAIIFIIGIKYKGAKN